MGQGLSRNSFCVCGSGKKFKRCCMGKKPRTTMLSMDFGNPISASGVRLHRNGKVELFSGQESQMPVSANWTVSYDREKGPKFLLDIPISNNDKLHFGEAALFENFDEILVSDANTKKYGHERITVAQALWCRKESQSCDGFTIEVLDVGQIIGRNVSLPEREAVAILIDNFVKSSAYNSRRRYGIIWDSEYDKHPDYNRRDLPILHNLFLPGNMTIIYASADSGKENVANQLVSDCDRMATETFNKIKGIDGIPNGWSR